MPAHDGTYGSGDVQYRVEGLSKTIRALSKAGADAEDMKDLMHSIGTVVVRASNVPVVTGKLQASVRAGRGKTKAVVRAGRKSIPYAPIIHYGWPARGIPARPFLADALQRQRKTTIDMLDEGIWTIMEKNDLD